MRDPPVRGCGYGGSSIEGGEVFMLVVEESEKDSSTRYIGARASPDDNRFIYVF